MTFILSDGKNLITYVNDFYQNFIEILGRLQIYIDDLDQFPADGKDMVKQRLFVLLDLQQQFITDFKEYVGSL